MFEEQIGDMARRKTPLKEIQRRLSPMVDVGRICASLKEEVDDGGDRLLIIASASIMECRIVIASADIVERCRTIIISYVDSGSDARVLQ